MQLVSVIIPTYNRPTFLRRAINSVLNQTYKDVEIIVVDDNNPGTNARKETEKIMSIYHNVPNVHYVKHTSNKNGSAARNTGIRTSKGKYIAFLDDDDEFFPNKIAAQVGRLKRLSQDYVCCYSRFQTKRGDKVMTYSREMREGALLTDALMRNLMICAGSNLLVTRDAVMQIGGFDESFKRNQDLEFLVRLLSIGKIAYSNELGLNVYYHDEDRKVNFIETTNNYLNNFREPISKLSASDRARFDKMINLQIFRYYMLSEKNIKKAFSQLRSNNCSYWSGFRYLIHLMKRYVIKSTEGYRL